MKEIVLSVILDTFFFKTDSNVRMLLFMCWSTLPRENQNNPIQMHAQVSFATNLFKKCNFQLETFLFTDLPKAKIESKMHVST